MLSGPARSFWRRLLPASVSSCRRPHTHRACTPPRYSLQLSHSLLPRSQSCATATGTTCVRCVQTRYTPLPCINTIFRDMHFQPPPAHPAHQHACPGCRRAHFVTLARRCEARARLRGALRPALRQGIILRHGDDSSSATPGAFPVLLGHAHIYVSRRARQCAPLFCPLRWRRARVPDVRRGLVA